MDGMLGKLCRWLRILGVDADFLHTTDDGELIRRALQENRELVTRDHLLVKRKTIRDRAILIESEKWQDQIVEFIQKSGHRLDLQPMSRCLRCNGRLEKTESSAIAELVPPYIFQTHSDFSRCQGCGRIYWPGTHVQRIRATLAEIGVIDRSG